MFTPARTPSAAITRTGSLLLVLALSGAYRVRDMGAVRPGSGPGDGDDDDVAPIGDPDDEDWSDDEDDEEDDDEEPLQV